MFIRGEGAWLLPKSSTLMANAAGQARAKAVGKEELSGVLAGFADAKDVMKFLKKKKVETLPELLSMSGGALVETGKDKVKAFEELGTAFLTDCGSTTLGNKGKAAVVHVFLQVMSSAVVRAPSCYKRMHQCTGLTSERTAGAVDVVGLWAGIQRQRGGVAEVDEERGSTKLLKTLYEGLREVEGTRLVPQLQLAGVKTASEEEAKKQQEEEEGEKEETSSSKAALTKRGAVKAARVVFKTLAAAATTELDGDGATQPRYKGEEGLFTVAAQGGEEEHRLDATYVECMDAYNVTADRMMKEDDGPKAAKVFSRFWTALRKSVSSAGKHQMSVGAALARAGSRLEAADEAAELARPGPAEERTTPRGKAKGKAGSPGGQKPGKGGGRQGGGAPREKKRKRATEEEEAAPAKKSAAAKQGAKKGRDGKPNSSGEICWNHRNGKKCTYGEKCRHKHLDPGDESDEEDVRERQ